MHILKARNTVVGLDARHMADFYGLLSLQNAHLWLRVFYNALGHEERELFCQSLEQIKAYSENVK